MSLPHHPADSQRAGRAAQVQAMFGSIAHRYDLLNGLMSLALHHRWRAELIRGLGLNEGMRLLDVCAGTGDVAFSAARSTQGLGPVVGCDFCPAMLQLAAAKQGARPGRFGWVVADALALPFRTGFFDASAVAFGIRNVVDPAGGFQEMARVTRPGGRVGCLEFGVPRGRVRSGMVRLYETTALPALGALLSRGSAYRYLPDSIGAFSAREEVAEMMRAAGLCEVTVREMALGAVCLYTGVRS